MLLIKSNFQLGSPLRVILYQANDPKFRFLILKNSIPILRNKLNHFNVVKSENLYFHSFFTFILFSMDKHFEGTFLSFRVFLICQINLNQYCCFLNRLLFWLNSLSLLSVSSTFSVSGLRSYSYKNDSKVFYIELNINDLNINDTSIFFYLGQNIDM